MTREDFGIEGPIQSRIDEAVANQDVIFKDTFPGNLGVRVTSASFGRASGTLDVDARVRHPGGYAHGGALAGFGDTLAAWATFPSLEPDEIFTTIEFKANFISGVRTGTITGEATAIHKGRRTMVIDVKIAQGDQLVAVMMVTQAIIRKPGVTQEEVAPDEE
ncbi:MAG: PaaI family thioesterase [Actinomycetota bacterium]|nr:PaaI family thioesterase [Actinomycetota bacterium]